MSTFDDPRADASEAAEALRGLAHATRTIESPADTYAVIGDLLGGTRALGQILDQLAGAHLVHGNHSVDDHGSHATGMKDALAAADELYQAGALLRHAEQRLNTAFTCTGRIAWRPRADHDMAGAVTVTDSPAAPHMAPDARDRRWISVVFLQGEEADEVLDLIGSDGPDAAIEHLTQWDYGDETVQAALENGYVYDQPPSSLMDRTAEAGGYALAYNSSFGHVSLTRQTVIPRDPGLDDDHTRQRATAAAATHPTGPTPTPEPVPPGSVPSQGPAGLSRPVAPKRQDWSAESPQTTPRARGVSR